LQQVLEVREADPSRRRQEVVLGEREITAQQHRPEREYAEQCERGGGKEPGAQCPAPLDPRPTAARPGRSFRHARNGGGVDLGPHACGRRHCAAPRGGGIRALGRPCGAHGHGTSLLFQNATASSSAVFTSRRARIAASTASGRRLLRRKCTEGRREAASTPWVALPASRCGPTCTRRSTPDSCPRRRACPSAVRPPCTRRRAW